MSKYYILPEEQLKELLRKQRIICNNSALMQEKETNYLKCPEPSLTHFIDRDKLINVIESFGDTEYTYAVRLADKILSL